MSYIHHQHIILLFRRFLFSLGINFASDLFYIHFVLLRFHEISWNFFLAVFDVCIVACDLSSLLLYDFTLQLDTTPNCPVSKPRRWRISVENSKTDVAWMSWADGS